MIKILYAGYGEIGLLGLSKIFSSEIISPYDIFVMDDELNKDILMNNYCKKYNLNLVSENNFKNNKIKKYDICISVHWRKRISSQILNICKKGGINLHPSLLPKYAGCSSLAWAIINNEKYAGFSWHKLAEDFDTGEIIFQSPVKINKNDTAFSLWNKVNNKGIEKLNDVIKMTINSNTKFIKQDLNKRTYFSRGFPSFEEASKINNKLSRKTYNRASFFPGKL